MRVVLDLSGPVLRAAAFRGRVPVRWAELPGGGEPGNAPDPAALRELLAAAGLRPRRVDLVLPATIGMVRVIPLPPVRRRHVKRLLLQEVQALLGLSPDELDAAWHPSRQGERLDVVTFLFHRSALARYLEALRAARLRPQGLYTLPATLRPALDGLDGAVAHLSEDGSLTLVAYAGGLPRQVQNSFITPGLPPAQEVARGLRAVRNQAGLPAESPLAVTGPGAHPELRAELEALGLPTVVPQSPDRAPEEWSLDAYLACLGTRPQPGLPPLPRRPLPLDDRAERANRVAAGLLLAAVVTAAAGEGGRLALSLKARELETELLLQTDRLTRYAGAEGLVAAVLDQRQELRQRQQELEAVPPEPADWLTLAPALIHRATLTGVTLEQAGVAGGSGRRRSGQPSDRLTVTGTAPSLAALDRFVGALVTSPFAGGTVTQFNISPDGTVRFSAQVILEGGEAR